jgi:hypothetical protein
MGVHGPEPAPVLWPAIVPVDPAYGALNARCGRNVVVGRVGEGLGPGEAGHGSE